MKNYNNITYDNNINLNGFQIRKELIHKLKNRFRSYGFQQIHTPAFEEYDLYFNMNGTINHDEMIKTIDNRGKVLVLRPDITIPITQKIASKNKTLDEEYRYFYVLDVFRQTFDDQTRKERTQAGVEYFGNPSPEADAELVALAIHSLKDLGLNHFKIEIGHAGFFKELVKELRLNKQDRNELKQLIQAKNIPEIEPFLEHFSIDYPLKKSVQEIPLLYGSPEDVLSRADAIVYNEQMKNELMNLRKINRILNDYEVTNHIVIDLGLINHMDYYSGIIFQGFIENIGKPVLMGGRYDQLADQFSANIPAIGFAFEIEALLESYANSLSIEAHSNDFIIFYELKQQNNGIKMANTLREKDFRVLAYPLHKQKTINHNATYTIIIENNEQNVIKHESIHSFTTINNLLEIIKEDND